MRINPAIRLLAVAAAAIAASPLLSAQSYYPARLEDKSAVYVAVGGGGAKGDGVADDTAALQRAIDKVQETTQQGVVFVPEGKYRITHTLYIWPGVRVIGYGAHRPVLMLADNTPSYGGGLAYMVFFAGARSKAQGGPPPPEAYRRRGAGVRAAFPGTVPPSGDVIDASPGTFYSAMSNIDFDMGEGNPGAVGIRIHAAQHCFLTHMEFRIRSGLAALNDVGNEAEDLRFIGGSYGIVTSKPSPGWQFTLLDSSFEGQREAAIKEHEAGLTLVRDSFRSVPAAVSIDPGYAEELWIEDSRFEDIGGPAITISNEGNPRTEISAINILCNRVPAFAHFRESGKNVAAPEGSAAGSYRVASFSHGLAIGRMGDIGSIKTTFDAQRMDQLPAAAAPAIRALPSHTGWLNLRDLGAKGDGVADDTAAIRAAIAKGGVLYVPAGRYRVTDTIALLPGSALVGLHPSTTQFLLADHTPGFDGPGAPKALLLSPSGGQTIVSGIGLYTGGANTRAVAALWQAGKDSLMDDVRFLGGHGTNNADGSRMNPYNANHTADPDPSRRWDSQFPSLWVANGGGGTFADIWTPSTFADAGMYVSDTETPGHVYELSSEHHVRMEVKLERVSNWELAALQTEEEHGEGPRALPLDIDDSRNILIANFHSYRVVGSRETFPYGVRLSNSADIRFRNLHMDSDSKVSFNDAIFDQDTGEAVRFREFESLDVASTAASSAGSAIPEAEGAGIFAKSAVRRLATGFDNISGAWLGPSGQLYFADPRQQMVYRWEPARARLETVSDAPLDAVNLFTDRSGDLMMVSYAGDGAVYALKAGAPLTELSLLHPQPSQARPGMTAALAADRWRLRGDLLDAADPRRPFQYVSPDGTAYLPAGADFTTGALYYGTKMADVLRSFGLQPAVAGRPFYVTDEEEEKTYRAQVSPDGTLTDPVLFAERGGEGVASDAEGRVYLAAGEVFAYGSDGKELGWIRVPERPIGLVAARSGKSETLYILARTSLYAVDIPQ